MSSTETRAGRGTLPITARRVAVERGDFEGAQQTVTHLAEHQTSEGAA